MGKWDFHFFSPLMNCPDNLRAKTLCTRLPHISLAAILDFARLRSGEQAVNRGERSPNLSVVLVAPGEGFGQSHTEQCIMVFA